MRVWLTKDPDPSSAFQPNVHPAVQSQRQSSAATKSSPKNLKNSRSVSPFFTYPTLGHFRLLATAHNAGLGEANAALTFHRRFCIAAAIFIDEPTSPSPSRSRPVIRSAMLVAPCMKPDVICRKREPSSAGCCSARNTGSSAGAAALV